MQFRFDEAWSRGLDVLRDLLQSELKDAGKAVAVRDLRGRLHLALARDPGREALEATVEQLQRTMGPYFHAVLVRDDMVAPDAIFSSPDERQLHPADSNLWLLDREVVGADWHRDPLPNQAPTPPRAVFHGIKGGVGRSTALCVWANHLANRDKKVLVVDLDLEAPGVSSMLLEQGALPDFGLVDWFVEEAVGNADEDLVRLMVAPSSVARNASGQVLVAPCLGSDPTNYLPKLSRIYADMKSNGHLHTFADRLAIAIDDLERVHKPDVVLIDSRSGIHDIAAIAITRLEATATFLFAAHTRQTWTAYRMLLEAWSERPAIARRLRDKLQVVAAQVPETERDIYIRAATQSAYDLFSETLYDPAGPEDDEEPFNFDVFAPDAPHRPLPIYWSRIFQAWEPTFTEVTQSQTQAAYGDFLERATELLIGAE